MAAFARFARILKPSHGPQLNQVSIRCSLRPRTFLGRNKVDSLAGDFESVPGALRCQMSNVFFYARFWDEAQRWGRRTPTDDSPITVATGPAHCPRDILAREQTTSRSLLCNQT